MRAVDARLQDGSVLMTPAAVIALRAHALDVYPEECVGFVDPAGSYHRLDNVSPVPGKSAATARGTIPALIAAGRLRALCHSHPDGFDCPSEMDMRSQMECLVPFVICATNGTATAEPFAWGDQLLDDAPMVGRPFRHAVTDCYATIRLYTLRERGILLPDYPRNWNWWTDGVPGEKDLYRRYFADAGFRPVDRAEPRPGDVWLAAMRSPVPNHAGVYLDGGLALHHPSSGLAFDPGRLSKREPVARWAPFVTHWLRRDD